MDGSERDSRAHVAGDDERTRDPRDETGAVPRAANTSPGEGKRDAATSGVGAAAGATGGAAAGAAIGTITLGPIGTIIGAAAGALGGGWVGLAAGKEAQYDEAQDAGYRARYESNPARLADRGFEQVRPAYQLGHAAARNPDYRGRDFSLVEPELRRVWSGELAARHGEWESIRPWVQDAYEQGATTDPRNAAQSQVVVGDATPENAPDSPVQGKMFAELDLGGTESHQRPSFSDPLPGDDPDGVDGGARGAGEGMTGRWALRAGSGERGAGSARESSARIASIVIPQERRR